MHIISRKALRIFWADHPDSQAPLLRWYKIIQRSTFRTFAELRATFPSADLVNDLVVFNIGGNQYRLVTSIHFDRSKVYVRHVLTHAVYDEGAWKV